MSDCVNWDWCEVEGISTSMSSLEGVLAMRIAQREHNVLSREIRRREVHVAVITKRLRDLVREHLRALAGQLTRSACMNEQVGRYTMQE